MTTAELIQYARDLARQPRYSDLHLDLASTEAMLEDRARRLAHDIDGRIAHAQYDSASQLAATLVDLITALRRVRHRQRELFVEPAPCPGGGGAT